MHALWLTLLILSGGTLFVMFQVAAARLEREVGVAPNALDRQQPIFLSTTRATRQQRHFAVAVVMTVLCGFLAVIPYASLDGPNVPAFPPVGDAVLSVLYLVTGMIIIGQFLRLHTWSLLILASGFVYQSVMTMAHALTFPGFFLNDTILHSVRITPWVYLAWRSGFPVFASVYAILHHRSKRTFVRRPGRAVALAFLLVPTFCVSLTLAIVSGSESLPVMVSDGNYSNGLRMIMAPAIVSLDVIALGILWFCGNSVLNLWLLVSMATSICDIVIGAIIGDHRFDVSWYASRVFGLLSAVVVLSALLEEMNRLYASMFKLMDNQQEESEAKYLAIVDNAVDAIIVISLGGIIKSFNKAAETIFQYCADEVIGQNLSMLTPEPFESARDLLGIGREVQGRRKDGSEVALALAVAEWHFGEEQVFTGILRDISDRKQIEQQLIQSQKMEAIGQLTGGIAHDFNNILGVIIGNLDMLSDQFPDSVPEELTDALNASVTGAELVQRLLAFARRQPLQPKHMNLRPVIENLLPLLRRTIGGHIEIETYYDDDLRPVIADPAQFENAVLNLIINSRDAMPDGGTLTIECKNQTIDSHSSTEYDLPVGHYVTLVVSDTGQGIPADVLPHVFEPFFTTKSPGKGSGLGLSMVFGYAKQSGGVIRIYSEVGRGTSVCLYLPRPHHSELVASAAEEAASIEADTIALHGNERILVVEDTPAARIVAQRILLNLGYAVRVTQGAEEALSVLESGEPFDMLFTDIIMPGPIDGIALAKIVKRSYPKMKILFSSGFSRNPSEEIELLHTTYITKPYRRIDLALILRRIFDSRRLGNGNG